jgi:hypothetical protein
MYYSYTFDKYISQMTINLKNTNDYQPEKTYYNKDFTKNLYTSLYSMSVMNLACGLQRFVFQG